mmetsp:Transcript_24358/g.67716  ORF Transcript_24358/g.67716 Transcript_24358/m.67716 type:complete len:237 (+) Transcript_24358:745-1455(+)
MLRYAVPPPQEGVDLVNEHAAGTKLVGQAEGRPDELHGVAQPLGDDGARREHKEGGTALGSGGPRQHCLAGPRRPKQQHPLAWRAEHAAHLLKDLGVLQGQLHRLPQCVLGAVERTHLRKADAGILREQNLWQQRFLVLILRPHLLLEGAAALLDHLQAVPQGAAADGQRRHLVLLLRPTRGACSIRGLAAGGGAAELSLWRRPPRDHTEAAVPDCCTCSCKGSGADCLPQAKPPS